jgi:hypothetical protein
MDRTTVLPSLVEWCRDAATPILSADGRLLDIAADTTGRLFRSIDAADIVFLGETNHFVHQKTQFRQLCLQSLALHWPLVIGEELSWSDGHRVSEFLAHGDDAALTRTATFSPRGQSGYQRADRDDSPQGILGRSAYPDQLMLAEHTRLYQALRAIGGISDYFGFDIYGPSSAYEDIDLSGTSALSLPQVFREGFPHVPQESLSAEVSRLERLVASLSGDDPVHADVLTHVLPLIDSLRYSALVRDAANYEATRPAMAYREDAMKRLVKRKLDQLQPGQKLVLMGHAFHLAKNDVHVEGPGIGPGGGEVLARTLPDPGTRQTRHLPVDAVRPGHRLPTPHGPAAKVPLPGRFYQPAAGEPAAIGRHAAVDRSRAGGIDERLPWPPIQPDREGRTRQRSRRHRLLPRSDSPPAT